MSVVLLPFSFEDWLEQTLSSLTETKKEQLKKITDLLCHEVFEPVFEARDKEATIEECLDKFVYYLALLLAPILPQLTKTPTADLLSHLYQRYRQLVKKKVKDPVVRARILETLDTCEEHDSYSSHILKEPLKNLEFLESLKIEEYVRATYRMMLSLNILLMVLERGEPTAEWSRIAAKFAESLEPFVATLQVYAEPRLTQLKKKASRKEVKEAKELRGPMLALES